MKLNSEELMFLIQASRTASIKGEHAVFVAELLQKCEKAFEKQVVKDRDNGNKLEKDSSK